MKLEIAMMAGAETKQFLANLTQQIDRLEALQAKIVSGNTPQADFGDSVLDATVYASRPLKKTNMIEDSFLSDDQPEETNLEDDSFEAPKKQTRAKKTKPAETSFEDEEDALFEEPAPKSNKTKALTVKDVMDACKARATASNRAEVLGILKRKFKVASINDLKPDQYGDVIKALQ